MFHFGYFVVSVQLYFIKMDTYHAAFWSDLSYSSSDEEDRYRTTHRQRTKQRGERDSWTGEQRYLEYETTWEEIERWSVDPGRVPEPAWDSLEQCENGVGDTNTAGKEAREAAPKNVFGGAHGECGRVRLET